MCHIGKCEFKWSLTLVKPFLSCICEAERHRNKRCDTGPDISPNGNKISRFTSASCFCSGGVNSRWVNLALAGVKSAPRGFLVGRKSVIAGEINHCGPKNTAWFISWAIKMSLWRQLCRFGARSLSVFTSSEASTLFLKYAFLVFGMCDVSSFTFSVLLFLRVQQPGRVKRGQAWGHWVKH